MNIGLFRGHLRSEIEMLPDLKYQDIQSFTLTTAVLLRRIVERLQVKDVTIPNALSESDSYSLGSILNTFIHYYLYSPRPRFYGQPDSESIVRLRKPGMRGSRSTKLRENDIEYTFRLCDYFDIVRRFAHDDLFLARYLLRRTVTVLSEIVNQPDREFDSMCLAGAKGLIDESLIITHDLIRANTISISPDAVIDYHTMHSSNLLLYAPTWTHHSIGYTSLVHEYVTSLWFPYPFDPCMMEIEGKVEYTASFHRGGDTPIFTFNSLICMFQSLRNECES